MAVCLMSKQKKKKVDSIELQIQKLKEKKTQLKEQMKKDVGKSAFDTWGIEDEVLAKEIIEFLKPQAINYINSRSDQPVINSESSNVNSEDIQHVGSVTSTNYER